MQQIQLNLIPFTSPVEEAEFAFYPAKQDGYCPIHKADLNRVIDELIVPVSFSFIQQGSEHKLK